ncbi:MAG: transcription-repair coupling factor, partial [Tetragenococcus halophilus]|nr:transcription-repair coupling factor [Tetragenococcus halophilus]
MDLIELVTQMPLIKDWHQAIKEHRQRQLLTGLASSAKTLAIASAYRKFKQQIIVASPNLYYANQLAEDLMQVTEDVYIFPVDEVLSAEMAFSSPEARAQRVTTLNALVANKTGIYILPAAALRKYLPTPKLWESYRFHWQIGSEINWQQLAQQLVLMGYQRESMIAKPGEFSIRGSILDIYPLTTPHPVRIELFDVEIDSIRYFDVATQRSLENLEEVTILPTTELIFSKKDLENGSIQVQELLDKRLSVTTEQTNKDFLNDYFGQLIASWKQGVPGEVAGMYADILYPEQTNILSYFQNDALLFVDDYARILETNRQIEQEEAEWQTQKIEELRVFPEQTFGQKLQPIFQQTKFAATFFSLFQKGMGNIRFEAIHNFQYRPMQQFFGQMGLLKAEMDRWEKQNQTVVFLVSDEQRAQK